jgi:hypothetical protein
MHQSQIILSSPHFSVICRAPQALIEKHTLLIYIPYIPKFGNYISTDEYTTSAKRKILRTRK